MITLLMRRQTPRRNDRRIVHQPRPHLRLLPAPAPVCGVCGGSGAVKTFTGTGLGAFVWRPCPSCRKAA